MLIDCICGESKFAINAEQIGFDGRLVKCGKCGKEWFQESKLDIVEKKLVNLDQSLHAKELRVINQKNVFSDKISSLERALEAKNKELENQKKLEQRLTLFETRIKDNDSEIYRQKKYEERVNTLEKQLENTTLDLFIKNTSLEKRSSAIQEQLAEKSNFVETSYLLMYGELPNQNQLIDLMKKNKFKNCTYRNLSGGIVAIHSGWKI